MENETIYVCEDCGSTDIEMLVWVDVNTKKYVEEAPDDDVINQWCNKCEKHVSFITKEEYEQIQRDKE